MKPSRRQLAAGTALAVVAVAWPVPAVAHAVGGTYQLPVPLWLYLAGAALAVAASFGIVGVVDRPAARRPASPSRDVAPPVAAAARWTLRLLGAAWWYGAIAVGFVVGDITPLPAVLLWVGIWVGLPISAVLLGNPWPSLSPFRTAFAAATWLAARAGGRRLDAGLPYPAGLARWPAVVLLGAAIWIELILPGGDVAATVAGVMLGYTALTLTGMVLFGEVTWLRNAELFEVLLGWFGRIGPVGRRSAADALCADCGERCDPATCVDCPECAVAADDGERRAMLRPWLVGLTDVRGAGWSDAAFIVLALSGVTYDGLRETPFGAALLSAILPPVQGLFGLTATAFLLVDTLAFALVVGLFAAAFAAAVVATGAVLVPRPPAPLGALAGGYAATVLPIAAGYLVAHYLTLVIQAAAWLPSLVADPLTSLSPELDWIPTSLVWYLSVVSIVGGHVAAVVLAHRLALRHSPRQAFGAGLPMILLMIAYTVLSLWIIAQPIVVEPGGPMTGAGR